MAQILMPTGTKPADEPDNLFIRFALLDQDPRNIQAFAKRYGALVEAESAGQWPEEIASMRRAISVWLELRRLRGEEAEAQLIELFPQTGELLVGQDAGEMFADLFPAVRWPPAVLALYVELHELCRRGTRGGRTGVLLTMDLEGLRFTPEPVGKDMFGRVWLQLARAVSENWRLRICAQCGTPFRVTDVRAMYCSATCKVAASRARSTKR
jgi:hypothetical protein